MVMENGFSSPRREAFPAGLRVLVVDDDLAWLKILEKMLKKCSYEVTTCGLAREALKLLRERKDGFDIVISDVNMPDMDGFKLLEHVGLEMDLPVIMMSVDGETKRVMKGVQHGACDYLLKPIRMKELKNIWQHVVRKRMHEVRDIECIDDRNGPDSSNDGHFGGDQTLLRKRKDIDNYKHDDKDSADASSTKKARVVWTVELHQKFVKAVNQIGIDSDKVGPKKILDLMNVPWLTRENVASHLQKYRLYLSRIRKEDKTESSSGGVKNSDHSPKESSGSFCLQNASFRQQNDVSSNRVLPETQLPVQATDSECLDTDLKSSNLLPLSEQTKAFNSENSDPHNASTSQVGLNHTFGSLETGISYASFESPVSSQYAWPPELKPHSNLDDCFNQATVPFVQQSIQADLLEPAPHISPGPSIGNNLGLIDIKPLKPEANDLRQISPVLESFPVSNPDAFGCAFDMSLDMKSQNSKEESTSVSKQVPLERSIQSFSLPNSKTQLSSQPGLDPNNFDVTLDMKNPSSYQESIIGQSSVIGLESEQTSQFSGSGLGFQPLGEDLMSYCIQGSDSLSKDLEFDYLAALSDFNFPQHVSEAPLPKYGLDYDLFDCVGQGVLFS